MPIFRGQEPVPDDDEGTYDDEIRYLREIHLRRSMINDGSAICDLTEGES